MLLWTDGLVRQRFDLTVLYVKHWCVVVDLGVTFSITCFQELTWSLHIQNKSNYQGESFMIEIE